MTIVHIQGMQGLGDNLHQRAIMRQLIDAGLSVVWLETPWPCIYEDMPALKLAPIRTTLRTQSKNMAREAARYSAPSVPSGARRLAIHYSIDAVRQYGSILGAMLGSCGCDPGCADFRFVQIPQGWLASARRYVSTDRPILIYRPLVMRTEWEGCAIRNPDHGAYAALLDAVRQHFYVVSIADLVPGVEWITGRPIAADLELHAGELDFQTMAGLFAIAAMVYCSPGFATVLAQAVGTPLVAVFGARESSPTISLGARLAPTLGIDPVKPCLCFRSDYVCSGACDKTIDLPAARRRLEDFTNAALARDRHQSCGHRLEGSARKVHESWGA